MDFKGNKKTLVQRCQEHDLPVSETKIKTIEGWEGKPKGSLQALWERGWIDESNLSKYTVAGRKDGYGVVDLSFSLRHLMASCQDFEEEESILQSMGRQMGVLVDRTPKCHCELAGEGIEYAWGCAKSSYRRLPLKDKRGKVTFRKSVHESISREVLTTERIRSFSRRARAYMCAYHMHHCENEANEQGVEAFSLTPVSIAKLTKLFKTHRCAIDFDSSFCNPKFIDMTKVDEQQV
jgi:hypothetical protein